MPSTHDRSSALRLPSPALIHKYDRPGPRYTSYPTAPEWSPSFDAARYAEHLARADGAGGPLSMYVHLPFCREMCRFCGCNMVATRERSRADDYLDLLAREVELVAAQLPRRREVTQLHWGGGTPTFLDAQQLARCHAILARAFHFAPGAEKAVEIDPAVTGCDQIATLAQLGFNRLSMGVQDFDPRVQEAVGRIQGEAETAELLSAARRHGFRSVNLDLMYGLPFQTPERWQRTLERVLALRPDRVAVFGFAYVPWVKPHQRSLPQEALPSPEQRVELSLAAVTAFTSAGYRLIGLDHFALESDELARAQDDGTLARNFQGYTVLPAADTVAFGVSAISDIGGAYAQNVHKLRAWGECVSSGRMPIERGIAVSPDDLLRRFVIQRVMCLLRLELREVASRFGASARETIEVALRRGLEAGGGELVADGLVIFDGDALQVTPLGRLFVRNVAMIFDAYGSGRAGRPNAFSRTV